jgi:hypothetical protein
MEDNTPLISPFKNTIIKSMENNSEIQTKQIRPEKTTIPGEPPAASDIITSNPSSKIIESRHLKVAFLDIHVSQPESLKEKLIRNWTALGESEKAQALREQLKTKKEDHDLAT